LSSTGRAADAQKKAIPLESPFLLLTSPDTGRAEKEQV
jgi:hypothetical protein